MKHSVMLPSHCNHNNTVSHPRRLESSATLMSDNLTFYTAVCQYSLYHFTHKPIYILLSVNTHFITSVTNPYAYCCLSMLTLSPHSQTPYTYCSLSILTLSSHSITHIHIAVCQYSLYNLTHKPIY